MKPWSEQGCPICRSQWERGEQPPEVATNIKLHARLHQCSFCRGYWSQEERYAVEIGESDARRDFPEAFSEPLALGSSRMDQIRQKLSIDLQPIYDYEMANGNSVLRVDEPAGTLCPLAVVFVKPLNKKQIAAELKLDPDITWHENADPHYEAGGMAGFASKKSLQFVYGPVRRS